MIGYEKSTPSFGRVQRKLCPIAQGVSGFCNRASEVFFLPNFKIRILSQ